MPNQLPDLPSKPQETTESSKSDLGNEINILYLGVEMNIRTQDWDQRRIIILPVLIKIFLIALSASDTDFYFVFI